MKSIVFLLSFGSLAYFLYVNVTTPIPVDKVVQHIRDPGSAPAAEPAEEPVMPDLTTVVVKDRSPLTHATVKAIHPDAIVFTCDQGIFKVDFDRLAPEFGAYFGPQAVPDPTPAAPVDATPVVVAPVVVPPRERQRTTLEDAQARLAYAQAKAGLEDRLKQDRDAIDRYYKQSTYEPVISESQFDVAKADFDVQAASLAQLEATGP